MDGWIRGDWFDSTGLEWINPSPNLRNITAATLYPGVGLVEGTGMFQWGEARIRRLKF